MCPYFCSKGDEKGNRGTAWGWTLLGTGMIRSWLSSIELCTARVHPCPVSPTFPPWSRVADTVSILQVNRGPGVLSLFKSFHCLARFQTELSHEYRSLTVFPAPFCTGKCTVNPRKTLGSGLLSYHFTHSFPVAPGTATHYNVHLFVCNVF